jgi:transcriptional regulator with XRE-family HTH domain
MSDLANEPDAIAVRLGKKRGQDKALNRLLGRRLTRLRRAYGLSIGKPNLTQREFSRMLVIDDSTYRQWESGRNEIGVVPLMQIRALTGTSIDTLLDGALSRDENHLSDLELMALTLSPSMADRIRWVREMKEPDIEKVAVAMGLDVTHWLRIEAGLERPTLSKLSEFAYRFSVSIDFLFAGRIREPDRDFLSAVLRRHPTLLIGSDADDIYMDSVNEGTNRPGRRGPGLGPLEEQPRS